MERARSRLSTDSIKSRAKRVMAKLRAASISRFVRSWRLRKSATLRRYLSFFFVLERASSECTGGICVECHKISELFIPLSLSPLCSSPPIPSSKDPPLWLTPGKGCLAVVVLNYYCYW